jgi:hypothetical protein
MNLSTCGLQREQSARAPRIASDAIGALRFLEIALGPQVGWGREEAR